MVGAQHEFWMDMSVRWGKTDIVTCYVEHTPKCFVTSIASSREKLLSSPVKTNERPARQSGTPLGTSLEPWATGLHQPQKHKISCTNLEKRTMKHTWFWSILGYSGAIGWIQSRDFCFGGTSNEWLLGRSLGLGLLRLYVIVLNKWVIAFRCGTMLRWDHIVIFISFKLVVLLLACWWLWLGSWIHILNIDDETWRMKKTEPFRLNWCHKG